MQRDTRTEGEVAAEAVSPFNPLVGPEIDWKPSVLRQSAWLQHVPFGYWIINALRPACVVELGTHTGVSYFSFCQAVDRLGLSTKCFAVDTWKGDEHAGFYGEDVFQDVSGVNRAYRAFSYLLRTTFDDARRYFGTGEVDLLHIDGMHTYEAVVHDFEQWQEALSKRGIILFHDINVRQHGFGVWALWQELRQRFSHFEFHHGHGLGVLGVGSDLPPKLRGLFDLEPRQQAEVRSIFAARGDAVLTAYELGELSSRQAAAHAELAQQRARADEAVATLEEAKREHALQLESIEREHAAIVDQERQRSALQAEEFAAMRRKYWRVRKPTARKLTTLMRRIGMLGPNR